MNEYSDEQIESILKNYKKQRQRDKDKYIKVKDNEDFKIKNRARAKEHYDKNKEVKKEKYKENTELLKAKACYRYYNKKDKLDIMISKYPDRYELLESIGYLKDKKPSESTSTS